MIDLYANKAARQELADRCDKERPSAGRRVKVVNGFKHLGISGVVTWHGKDKFARRLDQFSLLHQNPSDQLLIEMVGKYGYRVRVQPDGGGEPFFVKAVYVAVYEESGNA